jgi:hypothetical protein
MKINYQQMIEFMQRQLDDLMLDKSKLDPSISSLYDNLILHYENVLLVIKDHRQYLSY